MTADLPDWMSPAQSMLATYFGVATQIAALIATGSPSGAPGGVPLLAAPLQLYNAAAVNVPAATSNQIINNNAAQPVQAMGAFLSYEIAAQVKALSAVIFPFLTFTLSWYGDSGATILLYRETWTVPGITAGTMKAIGTGPVRGAYLQVTVTNEDPAQAQQVQTLAVYGTARPAPEPAADWRSIAVSPNVPGFVATSGGASTDDVMGLFSDTVPATGVHFLLCNLYNGFAFVTLQFSGTSPSFTYQPFSLITGTGALQPIGGPVSHTSAVTDQQNWATPRTPLIIKVTNSSATNTLIVNVTAIAQHQA